MFEFANDDLIDRLCGIIVEHRASLLSLLLTYRLRELGYEKINSRNSFIDALETAPKKYIPASWVRKALTERA